MSKYIKSYRIAYDGNDGQNYEQVVYVEYNATCDIQRWVDESGKPVNIGCVTDSYAKILAKCMLQIPSENRFEYWEEINGFVIPDLVLKYFK